MTREDFLARIRPLSRMEEQRKMVYERTGGLNSGQLDDHYKTDEKGEFILSNETMSKLSYAAEDRIHSVLFPPSLQRKLRLLIHSRYAVIPFHYTEFISINYVLSGHLVIRFPDRRIILQKGQLILMNAGITHSLCFEGEEDLVLGIQIERAFLDEELLYGLRGNGPVADFLLAAMTGRDNDFSYLLSGFENDERVLDLFLDMFCEAMEPRMDSATMICNYMRLLFLNLIRATATVVKSGGRADIAAILDYMEHHYENCTLGELADRFHFNEKYLGNLIRRKTGNSFSETLLSIRMQRIAFYLESTALPVQEIAGRCGYTNMSFFFRRFQERYGLTPAEYRRKMQGG